MSHTSDGKRWHDMGGEAAGPAPGPEHDFALWEKRVDALVILAQARGVFTVDGLRRALEDMGPDAFERMSYYERWVAALAQNLIERNVFSVAELNARMAEIAARGPSYAEAQGESP
ncbi:MAG: ScnB-like protein [Pseudomonadota bacterium]